MDRGQPALLVEHFAFHIAFLFRQWPEIRSNGSGEAAKASPQLLLSD
jgi:hypothetical protein